MIWSSRVNRAVNRIVRFAPSISTMNKITMEKVPLLPMIKNSPYSPSFSESRDSTTKLLTAYNHAPKSKRQSSFSFKNSKLGKAWAQTKQTIKQYGVLWFIVYWATFLPLFIVFTIPFRLGVEIVPYVEWLEEKGYMNWTKVFKIDTKSVISRIHQNDDFELMNNRLTGQVKYQGQTANMIITTVLLWEVCKPLRYMFYLFLCRRTVLYCRRQHIFPKFFKKY